MPTPPRSGTPLTPRRHPRAQSPPHRVQCRAFATSRPRSSFCSRCRSRALRCRAAFSSLSGSQGRPRRYTGPSRSRTVSAVRRSPCRSSQPHEKPPEPTVLRPLLRPPCADESSSCFPPVPRRRADVVTAVLLGAAAPSRASPTPVRRCLDAARFWAAAQSRPMAC
jgi:hypothetical protein